MIKAVIFDMFETLITHYNSPLYFSEEMAQDAGISGDEFRALWRPAESDRTVGKITLEELVEHVLWESGVYSDELKETIVQKRVAAKEECFAHLHPEILPMLQRLKEAGLKIGLISNCFSEEVKAIRESELFPYFDAPCLSYELGMQKPDFGIFRHCLELLNVEPDECLYVGDGGSEELETARELGMNPLQAVWYLKDGTSQPVRRKAGFIQLESPLEVLDYVDSQENVCPCCGQHAFESEKRGSYEICPICFWEDAPYPFEDPDAICSCNGVSLNQARRNFAEFGACRKDMIPYVKSRKEQQCSQVDEKALIAFAEPYYRDKDIMHNMWHIELVKKMVHKILSVSNYEADADCLLLATYFHGFIYRDEEKIRQWMQAQNYDEAMISKAIKIAWESQRSEIPETIEGMILHDAHVLEGGKTYLVVKTLITGSVRGQSLTDTLRYMEANVLDKNKCYLPETIPLCEEMNQYTNIFFKDLVEGIE